MTSPVLLYDGACGFCAESVQLVLRHDRRRTLRFAALQGAYGRALRARHPELAGVDSMVWVEPSHTGGSDRVLVRSTAALRVARYLGGWWNLTLIGWLLPRPLRDALYNLIARHRHHLLETDPSCLLPGPEVRERFLDLGA
ncbi:MAG TPA: DCC1-like thiol-disulfide oxidoreductase family protein [Gemmatimonadales bacterium]